MAEQNADTTLIGKDRDRFRQRQRQPDRQNNIHTEKHTRKQQQPNSTLGAPKHRVAERGGRMLDRGWKLTARQQTGCVCHTRQAPPCVCAFSHSCGVAKMWMCAATTSAAHRKRTRGGHTPSSGKSAKATFQRAHMGKHRKCARWHRNPPFPKTRQDTSHTKPWSPGRANNETTTRPRRSSRNEAIMADSNSTRLHVLL